MSIFKCKMCRGTLEITNETVATCEYCGTQQTLPRLDNDRKANLYDRANHFRRNNEFDKAMGIYEQILTEDNTDAEAYWSLVLCRYGIEYVEDPSTHKRIPTVNRAQYTSIFDDDNYKSALQYADGSQHYIYEQEAKAINEIQKGILAISQNEEAFDVFICYKETDNNGRRTPDSVLANDLYHQLTQEGFKVFFSRITLEDKLGVAYEPYIFAALNSAKVMVVLGTRPEYFKAVWVRNEWSRYLALIKQGQKKILIPAYKDMDPYDLPEEFSHLQAQDMSKLGFMQDLIRGIKKITQVDTPKTNTVKEVVVSGGNANTDALLKRAFMFLEDEEWDSADDYCEKVLDIDPENAMAYLGKLMAELEVGTREELKDCDEPFDDDNNYQKAIRFGDKKLKEELEGYIDYINERNEQDRLEGIYQKAKKAMSSATTENAYKDAAHIFETITEYLDSARLVEECYDKAEIARKDAILSEGKEKMTGEEIPNYEEAIQIFETISGWKDADQLISVCQKKIQEIKARIEAERLENERKAEIARQEAERRAKKNKKIAMIVTPIIIAIIAFVVVLNTVIIPNNKYNEAVALLSEEKINDAYDAFLDLGKYKDSEEQADYIFNQFIFEGIKEARIGEYITFGSYEQDNNKSNGSEPIEWLVLDKKEGKLLVISKYVLDCEPYNTSYDSVTWETCSLRKWLNNEFLNAAFSDVEKINISLSDISADKNPEYSTNPGNATKDHVFLLSINEANKYFNSNSDRQCKPTEYAIQQGAYVDKDNGNCWYWLRSPGYNQYSAAGVYDDGFIDEGSYLVNSGSNAVRPALWIDLES